MKVLIVGGGGREHALAWKAAQSNTVSRVFVAPGNAGTAQENKVSNVDIGAEDIQGLKKFATEQQIDLAIIGPEMPLVEGIVDEFTAAGLACFGPSREAAQLEGSKAFSKEFLERHNIPTARYGHFSDTDRAVEYIKQVGAPIVVKADGLAAGKGVIVTMDEKQAIDAVTDMLEGNRFGEAGHSVVIEEFLEGEEASFIVICDGEHCLPLASSQDHKARDDGDSGPNTGGMGAYSPAPVVDDQMHEKIMRQVILPAVEGMKADGCPYRGFLYAGIMITPSGEPRVLEFNCRFGDPETQPIMMRLKSDLVSLCLAATEGRLSGLEIEWDRRAALGVVMASAGYPESASKGDVITGIDTIDDENVKVFHAGTGQDENKLVTAGGRVLCVTSLGQTVAEAQQLSYQGVDQIHCEGMFCRRDIGYRAVDREKTASGA